MATIRLAQMALDRCSGLVQTPGTPEAADYAGGMASHDLMNRAFARHSPLCCWLGDAAVHDLLEGCRSSRLAVGE